MNLTFLQFCKRLSVKLTRAQRVLASVAFDRTEPCDLTGADRDIAFRLFGAVDRVPADARAVLVAVCGARAGKSYVLGALYSLWRALVADLTTLAPGELAVALIVAPDLRLARQVLRYALGAAQSVLSLASLVGSVTSDSFTLARPDGRSVIVECLPATRGGSAVRGRTLVSAVLDECAFFRDDSFAVNDLDVFRAVAPRVIAGGLVVLCSTPWAEAGLLHSEFIANHGRPETALAAHAPTTLLRDDLRTRALVLREQIRDSDNARREFGAEFMSAGSGLFFDGSLLRAMIDPSLSEVSSLVLGASSYVGGDLALYHDASALCVVHRSGELFVVAETYERSPRKGSPLDLHTVIGEFASITRRHGAAEIMADHHLLPIANSLMPDGMYLRSCPPGQLGKTETHLRVRDLIRAGLVRVPPSCQRLVSQLAQITSTPGSGGGLQIRSPRRSGTHGDLASAFVLALYAASEGGVRIDWDEIAREQRRMPKALDWTTSAGAGSSDFIMDSNDLETHRAARNNGGWI
ncbi:MAG TPA: hypothetical protein VGI10_12540 [Polyangiaceae bacterium]|jgi:hypothetical protein